MIPVRIKQFPMFVLQLFKRQIILRRPAPEGQVFNLCFFSCHSYFSYLYCSLHSLVKHADSINFKVLVFSDEEQPLSENQIKVIKALIPGCEVIVWPKSMGWGEEQIGWIWSAYERASEGLIENDYIARVDSDVFFLNDTIFKIVGRSKSDLVGDGHYVDFKYCQGGCYFLKVSAMRKIISNFKVEPMSGVLKEIDIVVEDIAASHFAKRIGLKVLQVWFMMFPDEFGKGHRLTEWQRRKFSCIHFVMKNKAAMILAYEKNMLKTDELVEFRRLSETK